MGLKDFRIAFDNQWSTYYPGQTVTGNIIVVLDSTKKIRGEYQNDNQLSRQNII